MPVDSPDNVAVVPVPELAIPPGVLVNIQVPEAGKLFNTTLPVALAQEGCVIIPTDGAVGVAG